MEERKIQETHTKEAKPQAEIITGSTAPVLLPKGPEDALKTLEITGLVS